MAEGTHFSHPHDEQSEPIADCLLESGAVTGGGEYAFEESPEDVAEAVATEDLRIERLHELAALEVAEEIPTEVASRESRELEDPNKTGAQPIVGAEIEIDWEIEVEAFVRAENEAKAASTPETQANLQLNSESSAEAEGLEKPSAEGQPSEGEVAQGLDEACRMVAGAICAGEECPTEKSDVSGGVVCPELPVDEPQSAIQASLDEPEAAGPPDPACAIENQPPTQAGEAIEITPETEENVLAPPGDTRPRESSKKPFIKPADDRRKKRRAMISAPVRVRGVNVTNGGPDEISTTIDVSRSGILFLGNSTGYYRGMEVAVIFPYSTAPTAIHAERTGRVVRIAELPDGRHAVAVALGVGVGEDLVDACGRKFASMTRGEAEDGDISQATDRPLVLVMDPELEARTSVKMILEMEGYQVIAVGNIADAKQVLEMCAPALVIAEVQGETGPEDGLPGFDLCAYIKETQRLKRVPVVLTTQSAYPSDYSNAHALGAIVCMAKPYKQERLGHIASLLAPLQAHKEAPAVKSCKADPKRKACATPHAGAGRAPVVKMKYDENTKSRPKYRFPSFR